MYVKAVRLKKMNKLMDKITKNTSTALKAVLQRMATAKQARFRDPDLQRSNIFCDRITYFWISHSLTLMMLLYFVFHTSYIQSNVFYRFVGKSMSYQSAVCILYRRDIFKKLAVSWKGFIQFTKSDSILAAFIVGVKACVCTLILRSVILSWHLCCGLSNT